ncbi:MAG: outer membrane beta-barrel protein [Bacteroidota bacterium]
MKKSIFTLAIITSLFLSTSSFAQLEIHAYGGWLPPAKTMYTYSGYRLRIDDAGNFGVGVGYVTPYKVTAEFSYMRSSSTVSQTGGIIEVVETQPINVEYYQLGALRPLIDNEKVVPYGLVSLGMARFNPTEQSDDFFRFAVNAGLGVKYYLSDKLGIRFQSRLLVPLYFAGIGIGCGIGTGGTSCGGGASFGSEIIQFDFTGGVVLRINN